MGRYRIGVDVGGTFTDFFAQDAETGREVSFKVPTVPADPVQGVCHGLERLEREHGVAGAEIDYFAHGTTLAVNTLIERTGVRLGLLVTSGFRDLLIIQRLRIPEPQNWSGGRPEPLIPRELVFEVDERLSADGSVSRPLSEASVRRALRAATAAGVEGVVVCLLHAFRNPAHEAAVRDLIQKEMPDLSVSCSHEVWPQMREYERAVVSIVNAYIAPRMDEYLARLISRLDSANVAAVPYITRSNGGVMTAQEARRSTVDTLLSGPASGVLGATRMGEQAGYRDLIALDVGGTSAEVAIVRDGRAQISTGEHVASFPIMMPVVGVSSIGAGGGSLCWLDPAGVLEVGPESAGADPGPACYGRGGERATLTDAFLVAGLLNPSEFAGGRVRLHRERAEAAVASLAAGMGCDAWEAAESAIRVAVAGMYAELSNLAARRGVDPREHALLAFGGAGPLVACALAEEVGMGTVVVPPRPGTLCAYGALAADIVQDFVVSVLQPLDGGVGLLRDACDHLRRRAAAWMGETPRQDLDVRFTWWADMRYQGQSYEVPVSLEEGWIAGDDALRIADAFHQAHQAVYSHANREDPIEVVDLRLRLVAPTPAPVGGATDMGREPAAPSSVRQVVAGGRWAAVPAYRREQLAAEQEFDGPALIDQADTTVYVLARWRAKVQATSSLLMRRVG